MSDCSDDAVCPLCLETLDATDKACNYCQCGYQMCLWCWNQLMETAGKENLPGRCPNCRTEYDKDRILRGEMDPDLVQKEQLQKKDSKKKGVPNVGTRPPPKHLGQVRVVQRNLVYAVGLPLSICREETLAQKQYFGGFGKIKKISVNRSTPFSQVQKNGPSGSAYVTYMRNEDALHCIQEVDGVEWGGKTIKACFGTTKYCNAFLKGLPCNNSDCLYLHDVADTNDSFSKDDMVVNGLASGQNVFHDMVHPTSKRNMLVCAEAGLAACLAAGGSCLSTAAVAAGTSSSSSSVRTPSSGGAGPEAANPIPISGAMKPTSHNPWGEGAMPASMSPRLTGQWGTPKTPAAPLPLNSPLADVEWPSLGAVVKEEGEKATHHGVPAASPAAAGGTQAPASMGQARVAAIEKRPKGWGGLSQAQAAVTAAAVAGSAGKAQQQQQPQQLGAVVGAVWPLKQQAQQGQQPETKAKATTVTLGQIRAGKGQAGKAKVAAAAPAAAAGEGPSSTVTAEGAAAVPKGHQDLFSKAEGAAGGDNAGAGTTKVQTNGTGGTVATGMVGNGHAPEAVASPAATVGSSVGAGAGQREASSKGQGAAGAGAAVTNGKLTKAEAKRVKAAAAAAEKQAAAGAATGIPLGAAPLSAAAGEKQNTGTAGGKKCGKAGALAAAELAVASTSQQQGKKAAAAAERKAAAAEKKLAAAAAAAGSEQVVGYAPAAAVAGSTVASGVVGSPSKSSAGGSAAGSPPKALATPAPLPAAAGASLQTPAGAAGAAAAAAGKPIPPGFAAGPGRPGGPKRPPPGFESPVVKPTEALVVDETMLKLARAASATSLLAAKGPLAVGSFGDLSATSGPGCVANGPAGAAVPGSPSSSSQHSTSTSTAGGMGPRVDFVVNGPSSSSSLGYQWDSPLHGYQGPKGPGNTPGGNQSTTAVAAAAAGGCCSPIAGSNGAIGVEEDAGVAGTSSKKEGEHWAPFQAVRSLFTAEGGELGRQESFPGFPNLNTGQDPQGPPTARGFDGAVATSMGFSAALPTLPGLLPTTVAAASSPAAAGVQLSSRQQSRFGFARGGTNSSSGGGSATSGSALGAAVAMASPAGFAGVAVSSDAERAQSSSPRGTASFGSHQAFTQQQQQQSSAAAGAAEGTAAGSSMTPGRSSMEAAAPAPAASTPGGFGGGGFGFGVNLGLSPPKNSPQINSLMQLKSMLPGVNVHVRPVAATAGSPAAAAGGPGAVGYLATPQQQHYGHQQQSPPGMSAGMQVNAMGGFGSSFAAPNLGPGMDLNASPAGGLMPPSSLPGAVGFEGFAGGAAGAVGNQGFGLGMSPGHVHGTPPNMKMNPGMALLQQLQRNARMEPSPAAVGGGTPGGYGTGGMVGGMGLPGGLGGVAGGPPGFSTGGMWSMNPGAGLDVKGPGGMPGMAGAPAAWPQAALWQ